MVGTVDWSLRNCLRTELLDNLVADNILTLGNARAT